MPVAPRRPRHAAGQALGATGNGESWLPRPGGRAVRSATYRAIRRSPCGSARPFRYAAPRLSTTPARCLSTAQAICRSWSMAARSDPLSSVTHVHGSWLGMEPRAHLLSKDTDCAVSPSNGPCHVRVRPACGRPRGSRAVRCVLLVFRHTSFLNHGTSCKFSCIVDWLGECGEFEVLISCAATSFIGSLNSKPH